MTLDNQKKKKNNILHKMVVSKFMFCLMLLAIIRMHKIFLLFLTIVIEQFSGENHIIFHLIPNNTDHFKGAQPQSNDCLIARNILVQSSNNIRIPAVLCL